MSQFDFERRELEKKLGIMPSRTIEEIIEDIERTKEELFEKDEYGWIQTYSGKKANIFDFKEEDIDIVDIAHSLSLQCRFNGHVNWFYSVAQHSLMACYIIEVLMAEPEPALQALLHDAGEAYIGDLPKPIKANGRFKVFSEIEDILMEVISKKFGINSKMSPKLEEVDIFCCLYEGKQLMPFIEDWELYKKFYNEIYCHYEQHILTEEEWEHLNKYTSNIFDLNFWESSFIQKYYQLKTEIERGK